MKTTHLRHLAPALLLTLLVVGVTTVTPLVALAQGPMTNGYKHFGTISLAGEIDTWTFAAMNGDSIVIRAGDATPLPNTFTPRIKLYGPAGNLLGSDTAATDAHEVAVVATTNGLFSVEVTHGTTAGDYRITLAKTPGAITVAPGDEGGPMTNGVMHTGVIPIGDLDAWTFSAEAGERVVLRAGTITNLNTFSPRLRLIGPDGATVAETTGAYSGSEFNVVITNGGNFNVLVHGGQGDGEYRLTLAKVPGEFGVSPGDEGGAMSNSVLHAGFISAGDLDVWSFNLCAGNVFELQIAELPGGTNFEPALRVYAPSGVLTLSTNGTNAVQISGTALLTGRYTLLVADNDTTDAGAGPYELMGTGIYSGLSLCQPLLQGTNLILQAVGGAPGSNGVLLASTSITVPIQSWTLVASNTFGGYGGFSVTNLFNPALPQQFFRVRTP